MIDVGRRPEPQLGAVLPTREHHREVVFPRHQELPLLLFTQLRDTPDQVSDVLSWKLLNLVCYCVSYKTD